MDNFFYTQINFFESKKYMTKSQMYTSYSSLATSRSVQMSIVVVVNLPRRFAILRVKIERLNDKNPMRITLGCGNNQHSVKARLQPSDANGIELKKHAHDH